MKIIKVQYIYIFLILLLGLFLRIVLIKVVPPGLANDEANIILNAQSLLHTGKNIPGVVTGIFGTPSGNYDGGIHSELSSFLLSLVYSISGFSLSTIKLPFALTSLGVSVFIYLIAKRLFNRTIANIALFLSVINPWLIHFGRAGYESVLSTFFYLTAIYIFLITKSWKIFYCLPFLVFGFFCYFSAKVLLLPLSFSFLILVVLQHKRDSLKQVVILNIIVVFFIAVYFIILRNSVSGSRITELGNKSYSSIVDNNRTKSINFPIEKIVENKYFENIFLRVGYSLGGMSANFLFLNGIPESSGHLSIPDHGPMYLIDLLMLFLGITFLFRKYIKEAIYLSFLVLITFIPNLVNIQNYTYSIRPVILIPVLIIIVSAGIFALYKSIPGKILRVTVMGIAVFCYLFLFLRFVFQYYYRMPIENNDSWFFQDRIATRYIQLLLKKNPNKNVIWVTPFVHHTFYRYIFFSGLYTDATNIRNINELLKSKNYSIGNLTIQANCPQNYNIDTNFYLVDSTLKCRIPEVIAIIANIDDAGAKYRFINDPLCQNYSHNRYPLIKVFSLLNVENLSEEEFCVNYVSNSQ